MLRFDEDPAPGDEPEQGTHDASSSLNGLDAEGTLDAVAVAQRDVNIAQARQLALAAHWADLHGNLGSQHMAQQARGGERVVLIGGEGTPDVTEFCAAEFGAAMSVSTVSARLLMADALDLRHRLPRLWQLLQCGSLKVWMARRIANQTRHLSADAASRVDAAMATIVGRLTGGRFEHALAAAIIAADRQVAKARAEAARNRQGVWVGRNIEDGYATLVGRAPAPDLKAVDVSLDQVASALTVLGDTDDHDLRRAKALALLANPEAVLDVLRRADEVLEASTDDATLEGPHDGTSPGRAPASLGDAVLYVHLTDSSLTNGDDQTARVEDVGPALLGQVREWLGHRRVIVKPIIDLPGIRPVDCYEVPVRMAEAIRLRSPGSCFPHSPNISRAGDCDHTKPFAPRDEGGPPGQTSTSNLGRLPRSEHRIKTFGGWRAIQPRSGCWLWRSPHGLGFLVDEHGTHPLGKLR